MGKATCVIIFDKKNSQDGFRYIAKDYYGNSHIGYIWVEKPWYSQETEWTYYIRYEEYKGGGFCGGASSSGFVDVIVNPTTIKPYNQIEEIKYDLERDFAVKLVKNTSDMNNYITIINNEDEIPYKLWGIKK